MKLRRFLVPIFMLSLAWQAGGTGGEASSSPQASRIIASAMGPSPIAKNLEELTDRIGGRRSTSPEMRRAVQWAIQAFRQAGVDEVHAEHFSMPVSWAEGDTRVTVIAPDRFAVRAVSIGWSPPTPDAGLEAPVVDVGEGTEADFSRAGSALRGSMLLIHRRLLRTWEDLFDDYITAPGIIDRALQAGATGILWMSSRPRDLLYRHQNSMDGKLDRLPQVIVAREDALRIGRLAALGPVRVHLNLPNRVGGPYRESNVVAEIRGGEKPQEIVVLGAHLDSWELGTGALDNGCNAALVIDAARALRAAGRPPRRTVRFVLFSGEEQGMLGSEAYVRAHRGEMDNTVAAVVLDEGMGRITGYSLGGRKDILEAVREVLKPVESWGSNQHTLDADDGTDHMDFLLEGIPTLVANQAEANYIVNYHASSDTFDKVDIPQLKLHTALAAVTVWGIADRPQRLGKRQSRAEIEALIQSTGLDGQMKTFGQWKAWSDGTRGRRP